MRSKATRLASDQAKRERSCRYLRSSMAISAVHTWTFSALALVPTNVLILRFCFRALKNVSFRQGCVGSDDRGIDRSAQAAEEEVNASLDASVDFGLAGGRRHEVAARLALVECHAVDVNLLAGERGRAGQADRVRRDASDQRGPGAVGAGRRLRLGGRPAHRSTSPRRSCPNESPTGSPKCTADPWRALAGIDRRLELL